MTRHTLRERANVSLHAVQDALLFVVVGMLLYAAGIATAGNRLLAALCSSAFCPSASTIRASLEPWILVALGIALLAGLAFGVAKRIETRRHGGETA